MISLFDLDVVLNELLPIIYTLTEDKISKIREIAAVCLGNLMNLIIENFDSHFMIDTFKTYAKSESYYKRQTFIIACESLSKNKKLSKLFGQEIMNFSSEKAANLRVLCGRVVRKARQAFGDNNFWTTLEEKLSHDFDADVRFEVCGKYDVERGIVKLRPNLKKTAELMPPMFRALFPDDDVQDVLFLKSNYVQLFGMLKHSVTPAMNGFVENILLQTVNKSKLLIDF